MRTRLNTIAPDLDATLAAAPAQSTRQAAWSAARWAVERVGLDHPAVREALTTHRLGSVPRLVNELDERYFALSQKREEERDQRYMARPEEHEEISVSNEEVRAAFRLARAAAAVEFAASGEPIEAIYEAAHAADEIPAIPEVRRLVARSLSGDG
jgi:hypothetical protein